MHSSHETIFEQAIDENRPMKVICIGAGYSGIITAIQLPRAIPNLQLVIYEKNKDIGGTWHENTYPGVACDIPSHVYQFTFASNPNWSRFYAPGGEIQEYLKDICWKYDVEKYVRFRRLFEKAEWDEPAQEWKVTIRDLDTNEIFVDRCNVLLKGTGLLNAWNWPDIPGIHDFKGPYMHSAQWDHTFDWTNKRVALIGGGSSGVQILPQIQPKAQKVIHFMKGKNWISPVGYGEEEGRGLDRVEHTPEERSHFVNNPDQYHQYRHKIESGNNKSQLVTFKGTDIQKQFWKISDDFMREKLKSKPHIYESLTPKYPPGCRRLTPGPGYLEALVKDNVDFVGTGISKVDERGILGTDGKYYEVDAIIYATGYDYSFNAGSTPIIGRNGVVLQDIWDPHPEAYLGVCSPKMPNLFLYLGPNGGPAAGSFISMLEVVVFYFIKCIKKLQREHIASMEVSDRAHVAFQDCVERYFDKTIFTYSCKSWFKRNQDNGRVVGLWPGSSLQAQEAFANPRYEDFIYVQMPETETNPLAWFGNGMTVAQEKDEKTTGYLDDVEIPPVINHGPRPNLNGLPHHFQEVAIDKELPKAIENHIEEMGQAQATMPS